MNELRKLVAAGDLHKAADLMKAQLGLLEQQFADMDRRLAKLESREHWPAFCEATFRAPGVANLHQPAPERVQ
jgi:hypothetical protein